ncbi:response regulator, partial [Legionella drozanskii]
MNATLNLLQQIILRVPNYVFWKDKNLTYRGSNANFAKSLGFDDINQLIGKTDDDIPGTQAFAQEYQEEDKHILRTGESILGKEVRLLIPNEKEKILSISKVPLFDETGAISGILGIYIDITHIKENELILSDAKEKAEVASQAKTEFLENMRHDIRTPLTGIVGFADILKMEAEKPQIKEYADNLVASSHALLDLMDEVLEAIRVSSGEIPNLKRKFNLQKALEQIINLNCSKAAQKKLDLSLDFDPNLPKHVIGDKVRIHRIILELVANALNFTDLGFVKLTASLGKRNQREVIIQLTVEDSGIGIPKEKQQEIYVQFKRLTPSYKGIYKGAGLGLFVVKQFIDELGGEIYVESEPRKGSRFTCIIPLKEPLLDNDLGLDEAMEAEIEAPYETTYAQHIKPVQEKAKEGQLLVLVVEDNAIAQTVAKALLKQLNCEAHIAETGRKAVDLWRINHYDLIFMDIGLPDIDGYEVTHQIRIQELTRKTHTPIIALTAHAGDENKKRCIDAGMNAVITKPLTAQNCADILDGFIPGHHQPKKDSDKEHYLSDMPDNEACLFNLTEFPSLDIEEGIKTTGSEDSLAEMLSFLMNDSLPKDLAQMKKAHDAHDWNKT